MAKPSLNCDIPFVWRKEPCPNYRATDLHAGFGILRSWGERLPHRIRVFTSNINGQFQRAGFDGVVEVHGWSHHFQCLRPC